MKHDLISILMPVKNAEPFLNDCIESILNQSETNWELIAVDDGSTDSSYDLLQQFAEVDTRIKPLKNNGSGIIDALRLAYANSSGELITRMDADDKMAPDKLKILKRNLKSSGKDHIAVGKVKYFADGTLGDGYQRYETWLNGLTGTGANYSDIYKECVIPSPCWMVYREDLERCEAFRPNTYPEDYDLCFRFYRENLKVIPCNQVLHYWRDHPTRSSRNDENYADNRFLELKVKWFLKLDHDPQKTLILWGAGAKGKAIAKLLIEKNIEFVWICNNPNKIGKHVYGKEMLPTDAITQAGDAQVIVAVANLIEQEEIRKRLTSEAFWFC
ncbi:MAG: glycosyltransferase family 2 protein [Flavobacteriales bacterium]|nr:glycosyltransferase family 2 protein [Flavobacteriales bacterium]